MGAALLAIFFGVLGVHRFYLKRNVSGTVILLINLFSFGLALVITVPLAFIEGIYYAHLESKRRNAIKEPRPNIKKQFRAANQKLREDLQANNAQFRKGMSDILPPQRKPSQEPKTTNLNIIEVGKSKPEPIPAPIKPLSTNWQRLLEIPYERQSMEVPQIKRETLRLYETLCDLIDKKLHKNNHSLMKLKHELDQSSHYYGNILYTIYCVAEGEIEQHYTSSGYINSFSYDLLREHINEQYAESVKSFCERYVELLPAADETTRRAYHLTSNGLPPVWWDEDGSLRGRRILTPAQIKLLNRTPYRSTIVLNISEVRLLVIAQYLATMSVIHQHFKDPKGWPTKTADYLNYLFGKRSGYDPDDYAAAWIAQYLLKLCEQTIRQNIPYSRLLKTEMEVAYVKKTAPATASSAILKRAASPIKPIHLSRETIAALRKQSPQAWKRNIAELENAQPEYCAHILEQYRDDPDFARIAKQAIKQTASHQINRLVACFAYCMAVDQQEAEKPVLRILHEIVTHPTQQKTFMELAHQKPSFNHELIEKLKILMKPPVRSVKLDAHKVEAAHAAHAEAVKRVAGYLGEEDGSTEQSASSQALPEDKISIDDLFGSNDVDELDIPALDSNQTEFLRMVINSGYSLGVAEAESFAKSKHKLLGGLVQGINQQYYEVLEDQLLCTVNDKITIEEIYREQVKEILK